MPIRSQSPLSHLTQSASAWRRERVVREGGTEARVSGLAQAQLFSSDRVCKPRVVQNPVIQEGFSGVPSGSGGYVGGREHRVDDDDVDDVCDDDDVYDDRNLLRRLRRIGILLGWLIIYM